MNTEDCLYKIELFARELLSQDTICELYYHNYKHTERVVENAKFIAKKENLNNEETFIVITTAWLHDLGYTKCYEDHEDASIIIADEFLSKCEGISSEVINAVVSGINATRVPQKPKNKIEKVISDADLFDLGTEEYFDLSDKLFREWDNCISPVSKHKQWLQSLQFIIEHKYFTSFGKEVLEKKKQENIIILKERLKKKIY